MSFNTPILFLVFNRPETTGQVFEVIRRIKPRRLFIAADGPRAGNIKDEIKCLEVKEIVENIDWRCDVKKLYRQNNLGCKYAVSEAISWYFEHVSEGIILEDDTLPDISFFEFCEEMLQRYRFDERIMHISGFNLMGKWKENVQSFHFSYFGTVWGWATWRRSWKMYDVDIKLWGYPYIQNQILKTYFPFEYRRDRRILYDKLYTHQIDTWDYQWTFCRLVHKGLSIIPSLNLMLNIGFDSQATHTHHAPIWAPQVKFSLAKPLVHDGPIVADFKYEKLHLRLTGNRQLNLISKSKLIFSKVMSLLYKRILMLKVN